MEIQTILSMAKNSNIQFNYCVIGVSISIWNSNAELQISNNFTTYT